MKAPVPVLLLALACLGCAAGPLERVDAPPELLQATRAHALGGRWSNLTLFCVEQDGSTAQIRTVYSSGDPQLDGIYSDTVARWRYKPTNSQSERCQTIRFDEDFGPERRPDDGARTSDAPDPGLSTMKFSAIYKPAPPVAAVAALARESKVSNWTLINRTSFCIQRDGTVDHVKTLRSTGLPDLDRLARAAVASWRYRPFPAEFRPNCVSTDVTFNFRIQ